MKRDAILKGLSAAALFLGVPVAAAQEVSPTGDWQFGGETYLWMPSLSGSTQAGDDFSMSFADIFEKLNFGAMGYLTARNGDLSLYLDAIYLNLDDKQRTTANIVGNPTRVTAKVGLQGVVSTVAATYRLLEYDHTRLEAGVGARLLWLDADLGFDVGPLRLRASDSSVNVDGVIGFRGQTNINDDWFLTYTADIGTGESDLTWQVWGMLNYRLETVTLSAGYRYMGWKFDKHADVLDDLELYGPIIGAKFEF